MKKLMRFTLAILITAFISASHSVHANPYQPSKYKIKSGKIVFHEPKRSQDQRSMLAFAAEPIPIVRIGVIGLGMRGPGAVHRFTNIENVEVVALCDLYPERVEKTQAILDKAGKPKAAAYSGEQGWMELCQRNDVDLIYIATPWMLHVPMAVYAMEQGKHVAIEVPAAMSVNECWQLVDTSERTRKHCMMLENCVYDFFEFTTLNMAQQGLFGEIIHAEGAYIHNLEPFWKSYQGDWRLQFNKDNGGDVYATHGLGPVCFALNIHRGDKMNTLVSMSTKSINGAKTAGVKSETFKNGDHTSTLISTEKGKTILIQHNVQTPRPYDRLYKLVGTDGYANKYPISGFTFAEGQLSNTKNVDHENLDAHGFVPENVKQQLLAEYEHPIQKKLTETAKRVGGHGGMDFIMDYRLIYCLQKGLPLDQDVYDAAEWSCIGELSATSARHGAMPVAVPDFTRGEWNKLNGLRFAE